MQTTADHFQSKLRVMRTTSRLNNLKRTVRNSGIDIKLLSLKPRVDSGTYQQQQKASEIMIRGRRQEYDQ